MSYLDPLFTSIRDAGQKLASAEELLGSAERSKGISWRLALVTAAHRAQTQARKHLAEAEARLCHLGSAETLPAPLDQLPRRLDALRGDIRHSEERLLRVVSESASSPLGSA
jgi:hypothetical protein